MKKIENVLLLPVLVLIVLIFLTGNATLDIHLHDTYYIIAYSQLVKWFLYWLVVVFILYTVIRYRHKRVNTVWAVTHISITIVLIALNWYLVVSPGFEGSGEGANIAYNMAAFRKWELYNQWSIVTMLAFLLTQIIFLVYFVTRLFQTPDLQ
jgi:hypothetical protein